MPARGCGRGRTRHHPTSSPTSEEAGTTSDARRDGDRSVGRVALACVQAVGRSRRVPPCATGQSRVVAASQQDRSRRRPRPSATTPQWVVSCGGDEEPGQPRIACDASRATASRGDAHDAVQAGARLARDLWHRATARERLEISDFGGGEPLGMSGCSSRSERCSRRGVRYSARCGRWIERSTALRRHAGCAGGGCGCPGRAFHGDRVLHGHRRSARFRRSKDVGPSLGLTPRQYRWRGRQSRQRLKCGDQSGAESCCFLKRAGVLLPRTRAATPERTGGTPLRGAPATGKRASRWRENRYHVAPALVVKRPNWSRVGGLNGFVFRPGRRLRHSATRFATACA